MGSLFGPGFDSPQLHEEGVGVSVKTRKEAVLVGQPLFFLGTVYLFANHNPEYISTGCVVDLHDISACFE